MAKKKEPETAPEKAIGGVIINLPVGRDKEEREPLKVWLNGVGYSVPRGVDVKVPVGVADIINNSRKEAISAANYLYEE